MSEADKPFVETVRIQNFGCARDVTLELTRLHALIGPNDSGKSTVLAAIRTACELIRLGESGQRIPIDPRGVVGTTITMHWPTTETVCLRIKRGWKIRAGGLGDEPSYDQSLNSPATSEIANPARGATLIRWDPDAIRKPSALIPEGQPLYIGERGEGIPSIYEAILSRDRTAFDQIEAGMRHHFATVKAIWLPTSTDSKKALGVTLKNDGRISADVMSEGLLYWLAFAALPHIEPTAILLIEEPENGLHPSRVADVVNVLREVSKRTQVIIATHSPLVINELQPHEVTILTRDKRAETLATRLDRTKHFQQRQQVYALGELWLSFADGVDEAALVKDSESNSPAE